MLGAHEKPDVTYAEVGGLDMQKQEIREAVELPLTHFDLYKQIGMLVEDLEGPRMVRDVFRMVSKSQIPSLRSGLHRSRIANCSAQSFFDIVGD